MGGTQYRLFGVTCHRGAELRFGHYTSYVRSPLGRWYQADDEDMSPVPLQQVISDKTAYLLSYIRVDGFESAQAQAHAQSRRESVGGQSNAKASPAVRCKRIRRMMAKMTMAMKMKMKMATGRRRGVYPTDDTLLLRHHLLRLPAHLPPSSSARHSTPPPRKRSRVTTMPLDSTRYLPNLATSPNPNPSSNYSNRSNRSP
jgi:hypothetical protein